MQLVHSEMYPILDHKEAPWSVDVDDLPSVCSQ